MIQKYKLETDRFILRSINIEDVNENYASWISDDDVKNFISNTVSFRCLKSLKEYVSSKINKPDVIFFFFFERESKKHIGNIKYEPIDFVQKLAVMGILIGDPMLRGKGVAQEVIQKSCEWLNLHFKIKKIYLGVDTKNLAAIKAYESIGFKKSEDCDSVITCSEHGLCMILEL